MLRLYPNAVDLRDFLILNRRIYRIRHQFQPNPTTEPEIMLENLPQMQRRALIALATALGLALLWWVVFAPTNSTVHYHRIQKNLDEIRTDISRLEKENAELRAEIDKIQKDPVMLEEVARKQFGLIRKNEMIYQFDSKDKKN